MVRPAAVLRLAGRLLFLLVLPLLIGIEGGPAPTGQPEPATGGVVAEGPPPSKASPEIRDGPASGTIVLFLPSIKESGKAEISPWIHPSERDRFVAFEQDFAAKLSEHGYVVVTSSEALGRDSARAILENAAQPLTPRGAADAAGAVGATVALVIRAETIHHRGSAPSASHRIDAIVEALAYRPGDAVRLTRASTRVSGTGATRRDAEAAALVHAAGPLATNLADSLAEAAARPMIVPRSLPIFLEGELSWDQYKHILALVRDAIPEIVGVEERRFARGRFQIMATCGCDAPDAARRLDGRAGAGIKLTAEARDEGLILRAMPISFH